MKSVFHFGNPACASGQEQNADSYKEAKLLLLMSLEVLLMHVFYEIVPRTAEPKELNQKLEVLLTHS